MKFTAQFVLNSGLTYIVHLTHISLSLSLSLIFSQFPTNLMHEASRKKNEIRAINVCINWSLLNPSRVRNVYPCTLVSYSDEKCMKAGRVFNASSILSSEESLETKHEICFQKTAHPTESRNLYARDSHLTHTNTPPHSQAGIRCFRKWLAIDAIWRLCSHTLPSFQAYDTHDAPTS